MIIRTTLLAATLIGVLPIAKEKVTLSSIGIAPVYGFTGGLDGWGPNGTMIVGADSNLYGTTFQGGNYNWGVFYKAIVTGDRANPTVTYDTLHHFSGYSSDGENCQGKLAKDGSGYIYGTCYQGGSVGYGIVYRINTSTGAYTILHDFTNPSNDGVQPVSGVVIDGSGNLYGALAGGNGTAQYGAIYKLAPSGGGSYSYSVLYRFAGSTAGEIPYSITLGSDGNLYGTTIVGGSGIVTNGIIWRYNLSTSTFTYLLDLPAPTLYTGLTQVPTSLTTSGRLEFWGVTLTGGTYNHGTVYRIAETSAGSGSFTFTTMHSFNNTTDEGYYPYNDLVFSTDLRAANADSAGALYGTTWSRGVGGGGSLFRIDLSGNFWEFPHSTAWIGGYPDDGAWGLVEGVIGGGGYGYSPVLFGSSYGGGANGYGWLWDVWLQ